MLRWGAKPHLHACCRRYWWTAISGMDAGECAICLQRICVEDTVAVDAQVLSEGLTLLRRCSHMLHTQCLANYLLTQGAQISRTEARQSRSRVGDCQQVAVEPKCPICRGDISSKSTAGWLRSAADKFTWAYLEGDLLPLRAEEMQLARARMASVLRFARALPSSHCMPPPAGDGSGSLADGHAMDVHAKIVRAHQGCPAHLWSARGLSLVAEMLRIYARSDASAHVLTNLLS